MYKQVPPSLSGGEYETYGSYIRQRNNNDLIVSPTLYSPESVHITASSNCGKQTKTVFTKFVEYISSIYNLNLINPVKDNPDVYNYWYIDQCTDGDCHSTELYDWCVLNKNKKKSELSYILIKENESDIVQIDSKSMNCITHVFHLERKDGEFKMNESFIRYVKSLTTL